jgi:hypothetical protein
MGCHKDSQAASLQLEPGRFPAGVPLANAPADAAMRKHFSAVCSGGMERLQGLHFKEASVAYLCRSFLQRDEPQEAVLERFGQEHIATADILTREGFVGKDFAAIVLVNTKGVPDAMVLRADILAALLDKIDTPEAAAAWAKLQGKGSNFASATYETTAEGWQFWEVEQFNNCAATELLDITVSTQGKIALLARREKQNPDGSVSVMCVD